MILPFSTVNYIIALVVAIPVLCVRKPDWLTIAALMAFSIFMFP
jgi:hypothetical protein